MTLFRLGYVAMSVHVQNASPSQTMTYSRFQKIQDREAAIRKLERLAKSNIQNSLRLLKHNKALEIDFFRLSSKLVPLATHEDLNKWDYIHALKDDLKELGEYAKKEDMRIDFHPDHFVVINSPKEDKFTASINVLKYHYKLLHAMGIDPTHRCVLHLGGSYGDKVKSLERFIDNWSAIPRGIQKMIMLENDDTLYTMEDCLYVCEKLGIPFIFDLHHHMANHEDMDWVPNWERVLQTWEHSPLPVKMHISSPKSEKEFKSHADYINSDQFLEFAYRANQSTDQIDCMIEAKKKDDALLILRKVLDQRPDITFETASNFRIKG